MKRVTNIFCAISLLPILLILAGLSYITAFEFPTPCIAPTKFHIARMEWIAYRGEMGWDGEMEEALEKLQTCRKDKKSLADALLTNENETIVSLGMDLVVRESFENGDAILNQYRDDSRVNFNLATNGDYARFLLAVWKTKRGLALTQEDRNVLQGWSDSYFERLGAQTPMES